LVRGFRPSGFVNDNNCSSQKENATRIPIMWAKAQITIIHVIGPNICSLMVVEFWAINNISVSMLAISFLVLRLHVFLKEM
jgi:hypothetical protein